MKIFFSVTTDLSYDQRMIRICTSLAAAGFDVVLVGRRTKGSIPLIAQPFQQKRLRCIFNEGKLFYAEYNIRLFFFLLFKKMDVICAIDLDTILPCYFISEIKRIRRVYDAHELFCEMKEIVTRPHIYKIWKRIEKYTVPKFPLGYTVNQPIADEFQKMYGVHYGVVRNISLLTPLETVPMTDRFILYQGAVNEGRSFETVIPAMKKVPCKLIICGEGNFLERARQLVHENKLEDKIFFRGKIAPTELRKVTRQAYFGLTIFENKGLSNYYSLANRFFDYIHAGIPQLCVDYPVYRQINEQLPVAVLTDDISAENLSAQMNNLIQNQVLYEELRNNCLLARQRYNWQQEERHVIAFYKKLVQE